MYFGSRDVATTIATALWYIMEPVPDKGQPQAGERRTTTSTVKRIVLKSFKKATVKKTFSNGLSRIGKDTELRGSLRRSRGSSMIT